MTDRDKTWFIAITQPQWTIGQIDDTGRLTPLPTSGGLAFQAGPPGSMDATAVYRTRPIGPDGDVAGCYNGK